MPSVAFYTLGCKVNQYETQKIAEAFECRGFDIVEFTGVADVYVINSCTVTHAADSKSRHAVRAAIQRNPEARVVLTGCYAETSEEDARAIDGVALVIGNRGKDALVDRVIDIVPTTCGECKPLGIKSEERVGSWDRTRAFLKVQDGCDQYCSYCAIPYARPIMSSRPFDEIVGEVNGLAGRGYREVVLAGIRLGTYTDAGGGLVNLLDRLSGIPGVERLRLSSIELTDIPSELVGLMARNPRICRHLHIPLQCGDDGILQRMNRPYGTDDFRSFVDQARKRVPGIAITTDIMVGFPGEGEQEFGNSYEFFDEISFSRAHVFRFSSRRGTSAATMDGAVGSVEKSERSARLTELAQRCSQMFAMSLIGQTVGVLVEGKSRGHALTGYSDNYVQVAFPGDPSLVGQIVRVRVTGAHAGAVSGVMVGQCM